MDLLIKSKTRIMKTTILTVAMAFLSITGMAQIDFEDKSKHEKKITAIPYEGEFSSFDGIYDDKKKAGVVGHKVTLLDVYYTNVYADEDQLEKSKNVNLKLSDEFKNKTYTVIKYEKGDILTIQKDSTTYVWRVASYDKYVFNLFIDKVKDSYLNKTYVPLYKEKNFEDFEGNKSVIRSNQEFTITKVAFAKLKFDFGILITLNDTIVSELRLGDFDQPRLWNGSIYAKNKNYVNIVSTGGYYRTVTLIEKEEFQSFAAKNKKFLKEIQAETVKIGMTEKQVRWAWGMPKSSRKNIAGYDNVLIYYGNNHLYFKKDILKLIK